LSYGANGPSCAVDFCTSWYTFKKMRIS